MISFDLAVRLFGKGEMKEYEIGNRRTSECRKEYII